jgi:hypothetical protein
MKVAIPLVALAAVMSGCGRQDLDPAWSGAGPDVAGGDTGRPPPAAGDAGAPAERARAIAVATGEYHACALLDDHRVKCWGDNNFGQLGIGDARGRRAPSDLGDNLPAVDLGAGRTATAIAAGRYATCVILDDGSVGCWGYSQQALGQHVVPEGDDNFIGDAPGELGDALPRVDLGPGRTARLLAVGYRSSCAVKDDESIHCWRTYEPPLDLPAQPGRRITQLIGADGVVAVFDDGTVEWLDGIGQVPAPPADAGGLLRATVVAASRLETCVIWSSGASDCDGNPGPWWPAPLATQVVAAGVVESTGLSCGIVRNGRVACPRNTGQSLSPWNNEVDPDGRFVRLGQPAVAISSGASETFCAVLLDGQVKCWAQHGSPSLAGIEATETAWPSIDLGTRDLGTRPER